jgi:hypothetical protein
VIKSAARCEIVGLWSRQLAPAPVASELVTSSSRTESNISKAKAKAIACLDQENPRLTRLERAFWLALKQSYGTNAK